MTGFSFFLAVQSKIHLMEANNRQKEFFWETLQEKMNMQTMDIKHSQEILLEKIKKAPLCSHQKEILHSRESETLHELLEDTRQQLKLSGEELAKVVFQYNEQLNNLTSKLEHERKVREKLEAELGAARAQLATALQEQARSNEARATAKRALQQEREYWQQTQEKHSTEEASQSVHALGQHLGVSEAWTSILKNELHCIMFSLSEKSLLLEMVQKERDQAQARLAELDTFLQASTTQDSTLFLDFMKRCLERDPLGRMTPSQALHHPWLKKCLLKPPSEKNGPTKDVPENCDLVTSLNKLLPPSSSGSKPNTHLTESVYSKPRITNKVNAETQHSVQVQQMFEENTNEPTAPSTELYGLPQGSQTRHLAEGRLQKSVLPHQRSSNSSIYSDRKSKSAPMTPAQAMKHYKTKLTQFEQTEIFSYTKVFFVGQNAKKRPGVAGASNNSGYDDDQGSYIFVPHDHIAYRYEMLKVIGKGTFSQVLQAYDHKIHQQVALKMVRNKKHFHQQVTEEIRILQHLRKQDKDNNMNVIHMLEHFTFRNHVCISFELLSMSLYEFIKSNKFQGSSLLQVRKFAHSILQCLDSLRKNKIIHCDLKPQNIMIKQQGRTEIKVIDFGTSCYEHQKVYTYIQSRFYRAPEVILGSCYGMPIDMWSFGCILVELLTGCPLFPGEDEGDQLACIIELLGMPPQNLLDVSKRAKNFINPKGYPRYCKVNTLSDGSVVLNGGRSCWGKFRGPPGSKEWTSALKGCEDPLFLEFVKQCLEWDPSLRMTPTQALRHSWLKHCLTKAAIGDNGPMKEIPEGSDNAASADKLPPVSISASKIKSKLAEVSDVKRNIQQRISENSQIDSTERQKPSGVETSVNSCDASGSPAAQNIILVVESKMRLMEVKNCKKEIFRENQKKVTSLKTKMKRFKETLQEKVEHAGQRSTLRTDKTHNHSQSEV
ncbi:dual specificity tyrosine-phosphorylation-regulated kinase 2-like [Arapaima gigas]